MESYQLGQEDQKLTRVTIEVVLLDKFGNGYLTKGIYLSTGKTFCVDPTSGAILCYDPDRYNEENPKQLFWHTGTRKGSWSDYRLRSLLLNKKPSNLNGGK